MREQTALAGRIRGSLAEIEQVVGRCHLLNQKAAQSGDDGYWDGVALNLHNFYSGTERVFEDIARTLDGGIPAGPEWHRNLLLQMAAEVPKIRPPVISSPSRACLEEYRAFRHVVRNVYAFNFRPARLAALVAELSECHDAVRRDLLEFARFLETV